MTIYHYAVVERPEMPLTVDGIADIDMENLDYKRQPDVRVANDHVSQCGGKVLGIWRGGMFGLATNQIALLSAWNDKDPATRCYTELSASPNNAVIEASRFRATVRPGQPTKITRTGFYVIRWIRMLTRDIDEYTALCLETWPSFEAAGTGRCYGVFRPLEDEDVSKILMLTWYASLADWEQTRQLKPADKAKWARRSEMELSHWADGARLVTV